MGPEPQRPAPKHQPLFERLKQGLEKTRQAFRRLLAAGSTGELEEALLAADVGVRVTELLVAKVKHAGADRQHVLQSEIARILQPPAGNRQPG
ncbi:hypothetical protein FJY71_07805, partial [candidate division WOR-3 bacterium]|nr:hypothetical protein [candidate division WOR-3 bacterium]